MNENLQKFLQKMHDEPEHKQKFEGLQNMNEAYVFWLSELTG